MTAKPRRKPTRAQYAALGVELAAAIRNEARRNWRNAAVYFKRAEKTTDDRAIRDWCVWSAKYAQLAAVNTMPPMTETR